MKALLFSILALLAISSLKAQRVLMPKIEKRGDTLFTTGKPPYQWFRNGAIIPRATQHFLIPTEKGYYAVRAANLRSPFAFIVKEANTFKTTLQVQVFDQYLRPIPDAEIKIKGQKPYKSDATGKFEAKNITYQNTITLEASKKGYWQASRRIEPTGSSTHTQIMLRTQEFGHELDAQKGGTISRGPFFLTLAPNGVLDQNGKVYTGKVKIALNGGRPDDPNFGWLMPGGDFMAIDSRGNEPMLYSYGFLSAELQSPSGDHLKVNPELGAKLQFVMPPALVEKAPDTIPLWHFDENANMWKESGKGKKDGPTYTSTVRNFSSWNCDWPGPWCRIIGKVTDCKGRPVENAPIRLGQQIINTNENGEYSARVPAKLQFDIHSYPNRGKITVGPFEENTDNTAPDLADGRTLYGYGVINILDQLKISTYNTKGKVFYSIDSGFTYQESHEFTTEKSKTYFVFIKDSLDCPVNVPVSRLIKNDNCMLLDSAGLANIPKLTSISEAFGSEAAIKRLRLNRNSLNTFPNEIIDYFPCLQELELDTNQLRSLPGSIERLNQLQKLSLNGNPLTSLPGFIGNLSELQVLSLNNVLLSSLPESIFNLKQLRDLRLVNNKLDSFPNSIGKLAQLKVFLYSRASGSPSPPLIKIPEPIRNLTQLRVLALPNCSMMDIQDWIGNLTQLQVLELQYNGIRILPESIDNLSQLQRLDLRRNELTSLPESIKNLKDNLKNLDLRDNSIPEPEKAKIRAWLPNTDIRF